MPRVLLITGQNNHDWRRTAPMIRQILMDTELFEVTTWEGPGPQTALEEIKAPDFKSFTVVVWDYNPPDHGSSEPFKWPAELRQAWVEYIQQGGKAFLIHASNNPFRGWPEFEAMVGLLWRDSGCGSALHFDENRTKVVTPINEGAGAGHGRLHAFTIEHRMTEHPVLLGLPNRWLHAHDELYHRQRGPIPETMEVLAMAWSDKQYGGTQHFEPMLWQIPYGDGVVMTWVPGHLWVGKNDITAHQCVGFRTILQRSVEWLATGVVTQPVPENFPTQNTISLHIEQDD